MEHPFRRRPSPATVIASIALFAAMAGTAPALPGLDTVFSDDIVDGEVKNQDLATDAVGARIVKDDALTGAEVKEDSLGPVPFADNAFHAAFAQTAEEARFADQAGDAAHANFAEQAANADLLGGQPPAAFRPSRPHKLWVSPFWRVEFNPGLPPGSNFRVITTRVRALNLDDQWQEMEFIFFNQFGDRDERFSTTRSVRPGRSLFIELETNVDRAFGWFAIRGQAPIFVDGSIVTDQGATRPPFTATRAEHSLTFYPIDCDHPEGVDFLCRSK